MSQGRDTHRLIIDGKNIKALVNGVDNPALLREVFRLVRELAFKRITVDQWTAACNMMGCILWKPEDPTDRHMTVRTRDQMEPVLIKITRVMWTATYVCSEQGPELRGYEELHHSCDNNGDSSTGYGACLNPAHLWRGDAATRLQLRQMREVMHRAGQRHVAAR